MSSTHNLKFESGDPDIKGFQEVVISVSDIDRLIAFYQDICGWHLASKSRTNSDVNDIWHLDQEVEITEAVMYNPGAKEGYVRLVQFHNTDQQQIRSAAYAWDSGGLFDINIRVKDMDVQFSQFENQGWHGFAPPLRYTFGIYDVSEVLLKGPEGIVMAAMQRFNPPLVGFEFEKVSRVFNSSIITSDLAASLDFYTNKLGFKLFFHTPGDARPHGPNVLGIPPNINGDITVPVYIVRPDIDNFGSIEFLQLQELKGRDVSELAKPPNLGLLMLRFPVRNAEVYANQLIEKGIEIHTPLTSIDLAPYGDVRLFSIISPEGVWLEFVELL
jgi:Lactoylglutathione lyase and related lyases